MQWDDLTGRWLQMDRTARRVCAPPSCKLYRRLKLCWLSQPYWLAADILRHVEALNPGLPTR